MIKENARANKNNIQALAMIQLLRKQGLSYQLIANRLNELQFKTRMDKPFEAMTVQRLFNLKEYYLNSKTTVTNRGGVDVLVTSIFLRSS